LAVGLADWCHNASAVGVAAIAWALTGVALIACWKVGPIKAWALNVDIRWLVIFHVTRMIAGIYFLALCHRGELPCAFALAAGWGDILVALLALVAVATMCTDFAKVVLFIWNTIGLVDIIFVVSSALRFCLSDWQAMRA